MKILRITLAILVLILAIYGLISGNVEAMPYMMFFMGALLLVMGLAEVEKEQRRMGIFMIMVAIFVFYVSLQALLLD